MSRSLHTRKLVVVAIALGVGLLHFLTGPGYEGPLPVFVNGYLIDILLPFAMYLVLGVTKHPTLHSGIVRCTLVFGIGAITETLQYFGVPIFGRTFDPFDYLMFAIGIGVAVVFEWAVLVKLPEDESTQLNHSA